MRRRKRGKSVQYVNSMCVIVGESADGSRLLRPINGSVGARLYDKWCERRNGDCLVPKPSMIYFASSDKNEQTRALPKFSVTVNRPSEVRGKAPLHTSGKVRGVRKDAQYRDGCEKDENRRPRMENRRLNRKRHQETWAWRGLRHPTVEAYA